MNKEIPLQYNFDGELVDNRTAKQKRQARQATGYQQTDMFHARQVTTWVNTRPQMPAVAANGNSLKMALEIEDPRTESEREADLQREAESNTYRMMRERPDLYEVDNPYPDGPSEGEGSRE